MIFESWTDASLLLLFLVLLRVSTLMLLFPIFGDRSTPGPVKILLSLAMSVMMFSVLSQNQLLKTTVQLTNTQILLTAAVSEVLIGLVIGFCSQMVFHAIQAGGDFMAQFMGLGMANQYDPHMETQTAVVSQFLNALAMILFLAMDGHHTLIRALVETFRFIPIGASLPVNELRDVLIGFTGQILKSGLQLAAPMAAVILVTNIAYGVLGKALPQLNLLSLSMASSLLIGLFVMFLTYPSISGGMQSLFVTYFDDLKQILVVYGGK